MPRFPGSSRLPALGWWRGSPRMTAKTSLAASILAYRGEVFPDFHFGVAAIWPGSQGELFCMPHLSEPCLLGDLPPRACPKHFGGACDMTTKRPEPGISEAKALPTAMIQLVCLASLIAVNRPRGLVNVPNRHSTEGVFY